jgi:hypothetical protein
MTPSRAIEKWLDPRRTELHAAGIESSLGRGPVVNGQLSATWISFEGTRAVGRATLWSSGRCQLIAHSIVDGMSLCRGEQDVTTAASLDAAMSTLTGHLIF